MAQAELHFLHQRLQGGKLNKAKKGELRFPLAVGYCYDSEGRILPDSDEEVRGAVELVFCLFRETGSAYAVVQGFSHRGLHFPKRAYGGAWDGKLVWGHLTYSRVLSILKNPSYAGMYVFGRYQYRREIDWMAKSGNESRQWQDRNGASVCSSTTRATSPWRSSLRIRSNCRRTAPTVRRWF